MIRQEEIVKQGILYTAQVCPGCISGDDPFDKEVRNLNRNKAFEAGAEWADKNPIKVWHKADEVPCDWLDIIVVDINTCMKDIPYNSGEFDGYSPTAWKNFVEQHNIKIWAYSEDLLPYNFLELFND